MALQLRIVDVKGVSRLVEVQPGTVLNVQPGDQITFADPTQAAGLRLERSGSTLVILYAEGAVELREFYGKPPATAPSDTVKLQDAAPESKIPDPQLMVSVGGDVIAVNPQSNLDGVNQQFPPAGSSLSNDALRGGTTYAEDDLNVLGPQAGGGTGPRSTQTAGTGAFADTGQPLGSSNPSEADTFFSTESSQGVVSSEYSIAVAEPVREGSALVFTITRTGGLGPGSVRFTTGGPGTASPSDFVATDAVLQFQAGETTKTVTVQTLVDDLPEGSETLTATLSDATNAGRIKEPGSVIATIINIFAPTANADAVAVNEDATTGNLATTLLANDTDPDIASGDRLRITGIDTTGTIGAVTFNAANQTLVYAANAAAQNALPAGQTMVDTFKYTIADLTNLSSTSTVGVTVTGVNDAPVIGGAVAGQAVSDTAVVAPFAALSIADADNGENDITVSVSLDSAVKGVFTAASLGASGFISAGGGIYTLAPTTAAAAQAAIRQLVFDPTDNRAVPGTAETTVFTVAVSDGDAITTSNATTVNSISVNDSPVAGGYVAALNENAATGNLVSTLLANDTDPDLVGGDVLRITAVNTTGTAGTVTFDAASQTLIYAANGNVLDALSVGQTIIDTFTYTVTDLGNLSATATVSVTVTGVNDAPVNTTPGAQAAFENTPLVFSAGNGNAVSVSDADTGINPLTVEVGVTNGTLLLSQTTGLTGDTDGSDGTLTFNGNVTNINAALSGLSYTGLVGFNGPEILTITTSDQGAAQDVDTVAITVTGNNDRPVLNAALTPVLTAVNEDALAPSGVVGTAVSSLADLTTPAGGMDNVTDADGPLTGIAITNLDTANGTWWFSTNNGTSWSLVGAVSDTNALLLSTAGGRLYYQPNANFNGTVAGAVSFKAWDGFTDATFTGTNGNKANTTLASATTDQPPFSTATDVADLTVNAINDAPVNTKPGAQTVVEDTQLTFSGATVISVADVDAGTNPLSVTLSVTNGTLTLSGTTGLTGDTDGSDGTLLFSGNVTNINAALSGLSYTGLLGFNGSDTLTITTSDQGSTGADPGLSGGPTNEQDVDTVAITIAGVNNRSVLNAALTPVLAAENEDAGVPSGVVGTAVSSLVDLTTPAGGLDNVADPDGPLTGIAITNLDAANGTWWFSTNNGTSWSLVGAVSDTNALLLSTTNGRLYYQPNATFTGTVSNAVTFKAWDGFTDATFTGTNGTKANTTLASATADQPPFSTATDVADVTVNAINDAPVNTKPGAQTVVEDAQLTFSGATVISVADVDAGTNPLSVTLSVTNGTLTLSGTTGLTGDTDGSDGAISVSGTATNLNAALTDLVFQGNSNFSGSSTLTITTSDQGNTGVDPGLSGGPTDEQDTDTVAITVTGNNDRPVLNAASTPVLTTVNEDAGAPVGTVGTAVSSLIDLTSVPGGLDNVTEPDGPLTGIAVTNLNTANGTWWFSINNGTSWSLVGAVSDTSALLLSTAGGRLYFQPTTANFNGTVAGAVSFKAWDGFTDATFTGTNGTKANTTLASGGADEPPFSAATDTADITVNAINDAPVNTKPATLSGSEDIQLNISGGNTISVADVDAGTNPLSVTLSVTNGTLALSSTAGLTGDTNGSDGTLSFSGSVTDINTALSGLSYTGLLGFSGSDTLTITTSDQGNTGADPGLSGGPTNEQDVDTVAITIAGVNNRPVLNATPTPVLAAVNEDALAPSGAVGTAVSSLADLTTPSGGLDNVADPDGPLTGIAITALNTANGAWWFSTNNGTSWSLVGAVSDTNALLLSTTNGRLYYQPNANFNGTVAGAVTFKAWDGFTDATFTGTNGNKANTTLTSATADQPPFSTATEVADVTVNAINDAPVNTKPGAQTVVEDAQLTFSGATAISVSDVDAGTNPLAVTVSVTNGTLALSGTAGLTGDTDGSDGAISVSGTATNLNAALNGLIFQGNSNFSGSSTLTITTSDQGNTGADPGLSGGPTDEQDVDTVAITVTGNNDRPVLNAALTPVLTAVNEDAGAPVGAVGTTVSSLADLTTPSGGLDNVTEPDGPLTGIAITNLDTANGAWWFSTNNGTNWSLVGAVSDTNALLLSTTNGRLYYQPNANFNGTVSNAVTFKAWDGFTDTTFTGTNGTKANTTLISGGADEPPFSTATDVADITVNAINDAPVNTKPSAQTVVEDAQLTFSGATAISVSDVDAGTNPLAVTLSVTNGTLALSGTTGLTGDTDGSDGAISVSGTATNLNAALNGLVFQGNSNFSGSSTLTITTSDQGNTGADPGLSGGPTDEQDVDTVAITVTGNNDRPVLNAALTPVLTAVNEDALAPSGTVGTTVSSLIDLTSVPGGLDNVTDPDGPLTGIAITNLNTANGTWWFSINNGTSWSLVGTVSDTNALLLSTAGGRLYFQPTTANFNGTVAGAVSFKAWDGFTDATFTGTNGTKANTTLASGGADQPPFSAATDTADITVNAINDAPVNTKPATLSGFEDIQLNISGGNTISVADVDAGTNPLSVTLSVTNGTLALSSTAGLTGDTNGSDGTLSFSGSVTDINTALSGLSYTGLSGFSGSDTLTITTSDQGNTGADPGLSGGPTNEQDVDTVAITIAGVNNRPVLNATPTPVLAAVNEDALAPSGAVGTAVSSLADLTTPAGGLDNVADPDGPLTGIAITALNTANGTWWFSTNNGTNWSLVGAVSDTNALLLSTTNGRLYYQPNANFNGTVAGAVTFKAWDGFTNATYTGTNGTKANTTLGAAENPFSTATEVADITVNAINDAPVNTKPGAQTVVEDAQLTFSGATAISVSDVDAGTNPLAVTLSVTNGTLTLSGTTGLTGDTDGSDGAISVSGTATNLNAALNGLVFQGNSNFSGSSTLTITTSDQGNTGADPGLSGGPTDEQDVDTVAITVTGNNDRPVLNAALTPVLTTVNEDAGAPVGAVGTAVSSLIDLTSVPGGLDNVTDPDGPLTGIAITNLNTANGTWWFSINNGTSWSLVGTVSDTNALLLSTAGGRLYFQPTTANFNGTVAGAVSFKAWDGFTDATFTGTNGTKANTTLASGGADQPPFSAATDTADITVNAINDAPVNTKPATLSGFEDIQLNISGGNTISVADVDAGTNPLSVTLSVTNGTLALSSTAGLTGDTNGSDGTLSFSGSVTDINTALSGLSYTGLSGFSGSDTLTITTSDQGNTGADPGLSGGPTNEQDVDTVAITIAGVNNRPVLNATPTPVLAAVNEDALAPSGAVGTAVSSLADLTTPAGGLDNVADPDGPLTGIAITALNTANGAWWFSTNNGTNWSLVGAVSDTNALLLSTTNGRLYYQPNANFNGTVSNAVTFKAWDGFTDATFTGTSGTKANTTLTSATADQPPFSTATEVADITINAINDAPVNTKPGAQSIGEDQPLTFSGATAISVSDVDAGTNPLAVTLSVTNGTLTLSGTTGLTGDTDGSDGAVSVSGTATNLNAALNGLVFQGNSNFSGSSTLTITTSDQGNTGADPGLSGGSTDEQDTDTVAITVTGQNDTPILNATPTPVLAAVNEDALAPSGVVGTAVSSLADLTTPAGGLDNVTDADGPLTGIAVTNLNTANGTWWFSTNNGTNWSLVGAVSDTNALLLSTTNGRLYYQPNANFNGTVSNAVTFKAWDGFTNATYTGTNGTKANTTLGAAENPFSTATEVADITVNAINDAPVNTKPGAQTVVEDAQLTFSGATAISVSDVDAGTNPLAVTLSVTNGTLTLSGTTGLTGDTDGSDGAISVSGTATNLNAALNGLVFQGNSNFSGSSTLTITTSDQGNTGADPGLSGGPTDEQDVDTVAITVTGNNDRPVLNAALTPVLTTVNEDAGAPVGAVGTAVSSLIDLTSVPGGLDNVTEPDGPLTGIAITNLNTANGTWWFSINNGTSWSLVGTVSDTNALLLSTAGGRLYFQPTTANFNGTVAGAVSFKAWDGFTDATFTGTNGTKANTTLASGGADQPPFSAATDTADITVNAINDAPVNTKPATLSGFEDIQLNISGGNTISVADVDAGTNPLSVTLSVTNGTLALSSTAGLTGDTNGSDGTLSFSGSVTDINTALSGLSYTGLSGFSGSDTLTITTSDQGNTGADPGLSGGPTNEQDVDTVAITIAGVNNRPVLNATPTPVLAAVNEDAGVPSGAVGTAVSSLADLTTPAGGLDNVADADGPLTGIAVTNLNTANGAWWFSTNNGTSWSLVGAVSDTNALLLSTVNGRLYYQPNANFNGTVSNAVTFKAWDGFTDATFTGTNGTKANTTLTSATADQPPFSTATEVADITVNAINDAPVNTKPGAQTVVEDAQLTFSGATAISVSDVDAGTNPLAVTVSVTNGTLALSGTTGLTGDTNGSDGTISVSGTATDLNAALNGLVFQGNSNFSGSSTLTITTSDQGNTGADPGLSGGPTDEQDTDTVAITVTGNNDRPVLNAALTPVLTAVNEDALAPSGTVGTAVSSLIDLTSVPGGLDNVTDPDGPLTGIAITNLNTANGTWWFSINNGTSWSLVGTVSDTNALLLSTAGGRLYFQPTTANFNGTVAGAVSFKAWDGFTDATFTGTNGTKANTTLASGGADQPPFSAATDTADITVNAINDAPVNTKPATLSGFEDIQLNISGGNTISVADVDAGTNPLSVTLSVTNGTLALSSTAGLTGDTNGSDGTLSFSGSVTDINTALSGLSYTGLSGFSGSDTLTITTSDQGNTGADPGLSGGPTNEQDVDTVAITIAGVNNRPVLNATPTPVLAAVNEDALAPSGAVGTAVSSLADLTTPAGGLDNVADPDGPLTGIAITALNTANGTWWFSTNNGTNWSLVGAVSDTNALLLSTTNGRLYYQPNANFNGTVSNAVTFKAWDGFTDATFTGTSGTKANTTLTSATADQPPFSTATEVADITINAINDAPVNTKPGAQSIGEDQPLTFSGATAISVSDVDAGTNPLAVTLSVTNGTLTLSGTTGLTGDTDGSDGAISVSGTATNLNAALNGLVFQGNSNFSGSSTLTITTSDQGNTGADPGLSGGPTDEQDTDTVAITVTGNNDRPVLNAALTPVLTAVNEDALAPSGVVGTAVSSLADLTTPAGGLDNVTDADGPLTGIAVTNLNTANGTWWFSINNGTSWSPVGAVSDTNALLLSTANGRLYYQPNANFSSAVSNAVTFKAWDGFTNATYTGTNGTKANTTLGAAENPFSTATDSADITVNAINDAPVNTKPGAQSIGEDQPLTFTGATAISVSDVDAGTNPLSVTLSVTNGTLTLSGTTGLTGDTDGSDGAISVSGTATNLNAALNGLVFQENPNFNGSSTLTITTSDQGNTGADPGLSGGPTDEQDTDTVAITVTGQNDTPILNATPTLVLTAVNEDALAPSGAVGTTVSSLVDLTSVGGGLDNVTDADGPLTGIAITNLKTANGTWWFSTNNGTSWSLVGAVSDTNALLLSTTNGRLYYQPNANFNGTVSNAVTFKAWDGFTNATYTGTNGTKANTTLGAAENPFSTAADSADITVNAINDAPVNTKPGAQSIGEDQPLTFTGATAISVSDVDADTNPLTVTLSATNGTLTLSGTTGLTGDTNGSDGTISVSGTATDLNAALNGLVFQGNSNFSGSSTLTITTSDQGNTGADPGLSGGLTDEQDSDTVAITVTGQNDTPILNATPTPVLTAVNEDALAPSGAVGTTVSSLVDLNTVGGGLDNVTDADGPLTGIAITALNTANGTWWFSTNNGTSWSLVGAVSDTNALLLSTTNGRLYYQPNANFNGTVSNAVTFKAWDGFTNATYTGTNGTKANTTLGAAESPFSTATDSADIAVNAVNDAPVNTKPGAQTIGEGLPLTFTGATAISVSDVDAGTNPLTVTLSATNGTLTLSGTTGLTGDTNGSDGTISVSGTATDLNAALNGLVFQGNSNFSGSSTLTITTSDQGNTGADPGLSGGPTDEQDVDTVAITVTGNNDRPVLNAALTPVLTAVNEDALAPSGTVGTTVSSLIDLTSVPGGLDNVTEPDGPLTGIAITNLNTANGTWWFSINNGTSWSLVGTVSDTNALLLSTAGGRLYFQPTTANFNGTVAGAVSFKAWDGFTDATFTGTNGTKANTTLASGGADQPPFSAATDTADITVNAINDAPVNTKPATLSGFEDIQLNISGGNTISVADVDAGTNPLSVTLSVTNGTLALSSTAGLTGDTNGSDGTLSFSGSVTDINTALSGLSYTGLSGFSGSDTLTITTSDQGNTGADPGLSGGPTNEQDVDTVAITIAGVNNRPVLNATPTPVLAAVNEDAGVPSGAVGTAVSSLADLTTPAGGLDNVADADGPLTGIAVTNLNTANGAWWFSTNNGTSWSLVGAVSDTNALLLSTVNGRLYYQPNANFNGTVAGAVTFKAWDGFTNATYTGTNGTKANTTLVAAESPFSTATDSADITVNAINDAPVNTKPGAQTIGEGLPLTFTGATAISVSDVDAGTNPLTVTLSATNGTLTLSGTTGLTGDTNGSDGTISVSGTATDLNAALNGLVFQGNSNFSGSSTLTITTSDQGNTGADPGLSGGPTDEQDTDTVAITVTGNNDRPVLNAALTPVLTAVNEDALAPSGTVGTAVSSLIDLTSVPGELDNVTDPDGPLTGIAITALNTANGTWWFSINNGTSWSLVGTVSDTNALLLSTAGGRLYFQPTTANFNGTVAGAVSFKAWDGFTDATFTGTNGTKANTTLASGGADQPPFSAATDTADITVSPQNDSPVNTVPGTTFSGAPGANITITGFNVTDPDIGAGLFSETLAASAGTITLTTTTGLTVNNNGTGTVTFTGAAAAVTAALASFTFNSASAGSPTITLTSNDQGNTGSGGAKSDSDQITVTVTGGNTPINLTSLNGANGGFKLIGTTGSSPIHGDEVGAAVSSGDVNGDGLSDIIVGAPYADPGHVSLSKNGGKTYVVFGTSDFSFTGSGGLPVNNLNGGSTAGFQMSGPDSPTNSLPGQSGTVANSVGDLNGDGLADIGIGRFGTSNYNQLPSFVMGGTNLLGTLPGVSATDGFALTAIDGSSNGFILHQKFNAGGFPARLALIPNAAGDINGDGIGDLVIGSPYADAATTKNGQTYVVLGNSSISALNSVSTPAAPLATSGNAVLKFIGIAGSYSCTAVAGIGDINGDGFADFAIGAGFDNSNGTYSGRVYVVLGDTLANLQSKFANIMTTGFSLSTLGTGTTAGHGFIITGVGASSYAGVSVSAAGDVNGDGHDDFIVGARGGNGSAYVVFGKSGGFSNFNFSALDGSNGITIKGWGGKLGWSVGSAGDFNGDGYGDVIVGSYGANQAYVIYGDTPTTLDALHGTSGFSVGSSSTALNLDPSTNGVALQGAGSSLTGASVANAGDTTGSGYDGVVVGAPTFSPTGGFQNGQVYVVLGGSQGAVAGNLTATGNNQSLHAGTGGATLDGAGFSGVALLGGAGSDTLKLHGSNSGGDPLGLNTTTGFKELNVSGGHGVDTLQLTAPGQALNFALLEANRAFGTPSLELSGIEKINLAGNGTTPDTLTLRVQDVLNMSGDNIPGLRQGSTLGSGTPLAANDHTLVVTGNVGGASPDSVTSTGWGASVGTVNDGALVYTHYQSGTAHLLIEQSLAAAIT